MEIARDPYSMAWLGLIYAKNAVENLTLGHLKCINKYAKGTFLLPSIEFNSSFRKELMLKFSFTSGDSFFQTSRGVLLSQHSINCFLKSFSPLYVYSILKLNTFIRDSQTRHSYPIQSPQSFFELQEKCKCLFEITKPTVKVSSMMIMLATMQAEIPAFLVRHSWWWRRRWRRRWHRRWRR
jgi:hypothetical protein